MPPELPTSDVTLIDISDLHLSLKPPIARSAEPDWLATQAGYLRQIQELMYRHQAPLVVNGDIFDKASSPSELVNFALAHLPDCYSVAGNHDLPSHQMEDIKKSSFWTLVEAGKVKMLKSDAPVELFLGNPIHLWGFSYGEEIKPPTKFDLVTDVAIIHAYIWKKDCGYEGAPAQQRLGAYKERLRGYDVSFWGDNHTPFVSELVYDKERRCLVVNSGAFMRRKQDERQHAPSAWLLTKDGTLRRHRLDVSEDRWLEATELKKALESIDAETFITELSSLGTSAINFADAVRHIMDRDKVSDDVRRLVLQALEGGKL